MKLHNLTVMESSFSSGLAFPINRDFIMNIKEVASPKHPVKLNVFPTCGAAHSAEISALRLITLLKSPRRQPSFSGSTSHSSVGSHPQFSAKGIIPC